MARSRNVKPGLFINDELAEKHPLTRWLFVGLWTIADREGRIEDRVKKIKASCLPFDDHDVDAALNDLASGDDPFIVRYEVDGKKYIQVVNWHRHQSPHVREPESSIPCITDKPVPSTSPVTAEPVGSGKRESGIRNQESVEGGVGETKSQRFVPPTVEEVAAYCRERGNHVDPQRFVDFYESKGWKVGKSPMKCWRASVRGWEKDSASNRGSPHKGSLNLTDGHLFNPLAETINEI